MKHMIVFTSLYFNKYGNQSMLETIKQYANYYNITIITSASDKDDYYLTITEATEKLPTNINFFRTPQFVHETARFIARMTSVLVKERKAKRINSELINLNPSWQNIASFKVSNLLQFVLAVALLIFKRIPKPDVICAYEIGGIFACFSLSRFFPTAKKIAKMQGTVLFTPIMEKKINNKMFCLDRKAYSLLHHFDLVTMTNDGTNGDAVLDFFSVSKEKYLFLLNGISSNIVLAREKYAYVNPETKLIRLTTISRLIGWKRVNLSIELIHLLVTRFGKKNYHLDIYGFGTDEEKKALLDLISHYSLEKYITLRGEINYGEIPALFLEADFLISLYKMTNITNPLFEAHYFAVPIISIMDHRLIDALGGNCPSNVFLFSEERSTEELISSIAAFLAQIDIHKIRDDRIANLKQKEQSLYSWEERVRLEIEKIKTL